MRLMESKKSKKSDFWTEKSCNRLILQEKKNAEKIPDGNRTLGRSGPRPDKRKPRVAREVQQPYHCELVAFQVMIPVGIMPQRSIGGR